MALLRREMILSDVDIRAYLASGHIMIDPHPDDECIQPASIDLHLGCSFLDVNGKDLGHDQLSLAPGQFALGCVDEWIELPNSIVAFLDGKSSLGRKGLLVHATAGLIDPGWRGRPTLEVANLVGDHEILLEAGMKICQIRFQLLSSPALRPYGSAGLGSHYQWSSSTRVSDYQDYDG
jgi:dCTP deaminase